MTAITGWKIRAAANIVGNSVRIYVLRGHDNIRSISVQGFFGSGRWVFWVSPLGFLGQAAGFVGRAVGFFGVGPLGFFLVGPLDFFFFFWSGRWVSVPTNEGLQFQSSKIGQ